MYNRMYSNIYKKIKKYDTIVIARHVGADPDALASSLGLKDIILHAFPKKKVYVIGHPASKFKYLGTLDKMSEELYQNSLLIVTDTPDKRRVDGVDASKFECSIKIDHHPFIEKYCEIEWIDDTKTSASEMILDLVLNTRLKINKEAAEKLYIGLVSDSNRFLFHYTTPKTFELISWLIKKTKIDITKLYTLLYLRPLKELKFQGYVESHLEVTEHGVAYICITDEVLHQYEVDPAAPGNMINNFNYIEEALVWVIFSEDKNNNTIRGSIRSRGPIINEVAATFGGGGHIYASGVRLKTFEDADALVLALDKACEDYEK
ncbi:MAG: bifunctional oligoribonuclease/PAP phosphatase NrnA [Bacilli bacterium]|jgi:phosphoesterase RecJ-like protein|nr:bifunctional oligoribonuclease/PAP phosphatase NrnA [Bacilli bacterium]